MFKKRDGRHWWKLGLLILVSSAGHPAESPKILRFLTEAPLRYELDPRNLTFTADQFLSHQLWAPLLFTDEKGKLASHLSESWSRSDDGTVWRFKIANDLKWSDGSALTPGQILSSLQNSFAHSKNSVAGKTLESARIENGNEIVCRLFPESSNFVTLLGSSEFFIIDPAQGPSPLKLADPHIRFSGAYRIQSTENGRIELVPNPHFRLQKSDPRPLPAVLEGNLTHERIVERLVQGDGEIARLQTDVLSADDIQELRKKSVRILDDSSRNWLSGLRVGKKGMARLSADERSSLLRFLALELAKDPGNHPATGLTPSYMSGSLADSEWRNGITALPAPHKLAFELFVMKSFKTSATYQRIWQALQRGPYQVKEIVYDPALPDSEGWKRRQAADYDFLFIYTNVFFNEPDTIWRQLLGNNLGIPSPISDHELDLALHEKDLTRRRAMYHEFEIRSLKKPFLLPLQLVGTSLLISPRVENRHPRAATGLEELAQYEFKN